MIPKITLLVLVLVGVIIANIEGSGHICPTFANGAPPGILNYSPQYSSQNQVYVAGHSYSRYQCVQQCRQYSGINVVTFQPRYNNRGQSNQGSCYCSSVDHPNQIIASGNAYQSCILNTNVQQIQQLPQQPQVYHHNQQHHQPQQVVHHAQPQQQVHHYQPQQQQVVQQHYQPNPIPYQYQQPVHHHQPHPQVQQVQHYYPIRANNNYRGLLRYLVYKNYLDQSATTGTTGTTGTGTTGTGTGTTGTGTAL